MGGLDSAHGASTMAVLPTADAVILVSDAAQEYTGPELDFLRQAMKMCPTVLCVLTKTDLYPQWRRIAELNRGHLAAADVDADLIPVSSTLRQHAIRAQDAQLNDESGFPELIHRLRHDILAQAAALADRSVANDVLSVTTQLSASMQAELAAYRDPNHAEDLIAELTRARGRVDALKERSARWQQTLNDGVSDLIADIDYDLRDRMRHLLREAEEELETVDPATVDEEFTLWLHQRGAAAASANFVWTHQRAQWLARQVTEALRRRRRNRPCPTELPRPDRVQQLRDAGRRALRHRPEGDHRHARRLRRHDHDRHAEHGRRPHPAQPGVGGGRPFAGPQDREGRAQTHAATTPERGQVGGPEIRRRPDLPGGQGIPRPAA
ncbi:hypothetical protein [Kutzneria sp. 744]|uniref:hypothetical protein n=1 Tax=Kutzneria sp. (strain 744) TaxID=345341 RepID=UPI001E38CDF9|nr:hypothetical protein [Kutzneria sp. 744]